MRFDAMRTNIRSTTTTLGGHLDRTTVTLTILGLTLLALLAVLRAS
jgi:hypothetical protein